MIIGNKAKGRGCPICGRRRHTSFPEQAFFILNKSTLMPLIRRNIRVIKNVFIKEKELLSIVVWVEVAYVLISALVILNVEPQSFENYFDAVYWATVSLTTMGYGDIYPVTTAGRLVTMVSSFVGIAVVALPAGIITSGLIDELRSSKED